VIVTATELGGNMTLRSKILALEGPMGRGILDRHWNGSMITRAIEARSRRLNAAVGGEDLRP